MFIKTAEYIQAAPSLENLMIHAFSHKNYNNLVNPEYLEIAYVFLFTFLCVNKLCCLQS